MGWSLLVKPGAEQGEEPLHVRYQVLTSYDLQILVVQRVELRQSGIIESGKNDVEVHALDGGDRWIEVAVVERRRQ